ncbi:1-acyl-sn-glycerol-3-phosphate acyltransferase [Parafilimonas sp.]|uniref:1-acyl-sn-glycerol-3-phosphate acyltransferase n=1 Tax=Parafilimonas sp. TaxID=1969739 RepID=UPI003F821062
MEKLFTRIYYYLKEHRPVLFISFLASLAIIAFFAARIHFEEDISKVLPHDKKIEKLNQVFQNSKFADKLVITVSLKDSAAAQPDSLIDFTDTLVAHINETLQPYISKINYKADDDVALLLFNTINNNLPVYLGEKDYRAIDSLIEPNNLQQTLQQDFKTLVSPAGLALKNMISNDPVGISFIGLKKVQHLQYDENYQLYNNYIITKDEKHLLIFITPKYPSANTGENENFLTGLDTIIHKLTSNSHIDVSYFGAAAVAAGNAQQLRKDTLYTQGITVLFLIFFIGFYFRKKSAPLLVLIPVVYGALFSLAVIYFLKGSISVIALGTGSVILGIAVNYSLHVFNHYRHTKNIEEVIKDLAFPLTLGSFTTIGGFLCLEFVQSEILKDLGLFAAFSLIGAALCSLIFLPHFIRSKKTVHAKEHTSSFIDRLAAYHPERNKIFLIVIGLLTIVFLFKAGDVQFESDMTQVNYMSDDLKTAQAKLDAINQFSLTSVYVVADGKNLNEALQNNEKLAAVVDSLQQKGLIKKSSGVSSLIISDSLQQKRIAFWNVYWTPEKKQRLLETLEKEGRALGFSATAFDNFKTLLNKNYTPIQPAELSEIRKTFLDDYITEKPGATNVVTLLKVSPQNKPVVYKTFENNAGITVLDKQYLADTMATIINADFNRIALMSSLLVCVVLLVTYGRIELALISFIPMLISWVWILGIMAITNTEFNIINIIVSALIFGLGDDYSIFIMDGLLQQYKTGKKNLSSFKSSIFLSAITTVAGLGILIFAKHPALRSIAFISVTGIICVVLISQVLIPFLFNIFITNRTRKKYLPWTLWSFSSSIFAFTYFALGSIVIIPFGIVLIKLNLFNKEKGKHIYHVIFSKFVWSVAYIMMNIKKVIVNPHNEDFSKPAVIICNHQSFLDILWTAMLNPKLILLTNRWVWRSPVFGIAIRMADYYPVAKGIENSIDLLRDRVNNGYSIVIFPEGTRSVDWKINRFHKGAFYLAEQLNIDILPIVIDGTGYTLTKNDFFLKDGLITLTFLPRIKAGDTSYGTTYSERTKTISRYFKNTYNELKIQNHTPAHFKQQLIYNYIYKGPVLEWYMRIKLRLEKYYELVNSLVPKKGKILDLGCGYGFMDYALYFASEHRVITGIDYDEEKIAVANTCFSKDDNINFIAADASKFSFEKYDAIIMSDVLHYLDETAQRKLIKNCCDSLNDDGMLLIRDANTDLKSRHFYTKLSEFFSTKFIGFNKTSGNSLNFFSEQLVKETAALNNMSCVNIENSKYTSNVMYVLKRNVPASKNINTTVTVNNSDE